MTWRAEAEAHARSAAPLEACGLLVVRKGRLRYLPCANVAADPARDFEVGIEDQERADDMGEVVGLVHSHPSASSEPSPADIAMHAASGLTWWILGADGWRCLPALGARPYAGRAFEYGRADCLTLVTDWFWRERGILIPDRNDLAPGQDHSFGWWHRGGDFYREHFAAAGFARVDQAKAGDLLLMRIESRVPNHAAVLLPGGKILHHLVGRLSGTDTYDRIYRDRTTHVLRHESTAAHDPPAR